MKSFFLCTIVVVLAAIGIANGQTNEPAQPFIRPFTPLESDRYYAYWLTIKGERNEYQRLLVTRRPIEKLSYVKSGSQSVLDNMGFTFQTYGRDSLWGKPFQAVQEFRAFGVIDGTTYVIEPCPVEDIVKLLENPLGKIPVHRIALPLMGAEQTAKAFRLLLLEQMKDEQ